MSVAEVFTKVAKHLTGVCAGRGKTSSSSTPNPSRSRYEPLARVSRSLPAFRRQHAVGCLHGQLPHCRDRTLIETVTNPRASRGTRRALTVALVKPARDSPGHTGRRTRPCRDVDSLGERTLTCRNLGIALSAGQSSLGHADRLSRSRT
jgi:hypothetical protein